MMAASRQEGNTVGNTVGGWRGDGLCRQRGREGNPALIDPRLNLAEYHDVASLSAVTFIREVL